MKTWAVIFMLAFFTVSEQAHGQLTVTDLKTTALDAGGNPELHLLLTGIKGPTKALRVQTATATYDIPWSFTAGTAEVWVAVGRWKGLIRLQLMYADGTHDSVSLTRPPVSETKP